MNFQRDRAIVCVPDGAAEESAFERVTHCGIGAHQDDLEIMAYHGIVSCYKDPDRWFAGVTCTNGAGSARTGAYAQYTDEQMQDVRRQEQDDAARLAEYGVMVQLDYPSSVVKDATNNSLENDLFAILSVSRPSIVYTHNPADKHDTHIGVLLSTLAALRRLPPEDRPEHVYGCEVWRNLDWMLDEDKVALDVSAEQELASDLIKLFVSQIAGGKRYDLATFGRWRANATYYDSHAVDGPELLTFAMDLTPLIQDPQLDIEEYVLGFVKKFSADIRGKLRTQLALDPA